MPISDSNPQTAVNAFQEILDLEQRLSAIPAAVEIQSGGRGIQRMTVDTWLEVIERGETGAKMGTSIRRKLGEQEDFPRLREFPQQGE